jgi:pimeloyl-ACP methyl ester carboxylesterase
VDERFCDLGDVTLCYETFGEPANPAVLLIMGLGTQMIAWHEDFCGQLADRGFHVIRFDNRDVGHSTSLDHAKPPTRGEIIRRRPKAAAYDLSDMAADAVGLLDHLEIDAAHVVGASMGGMIAQLVAAERPDRVLSLVSIMSNTGSMWNGQPALRLYPFLLRPPPREKDAYLDAMVLLFNAIGSSGFERDEQELRELAGLMYDRGINHHGTERQLAAILSTGDRKDALKRIKAPTLVIHGRSDRLVRHSGGRATARAIPGARLDLVPGMGHDLPRQVWDRIIDGIAENAARAEERPAARSAA